MAKTAGNRPPGEIRGDSVYTLSEFKQRTGLKDWGLRSAKRDGLPLMKCGRNKYIIGADWLEFLRSKTEQ
jgi:hypothetical protein